LPIYFFIKNSSVKVLEKHQEDIKKTWRNALEFFAKDFDTQGVQEARSRGVISKKEAKNERISKKDPGPKKQRVLDHPNASTSVG
jgi:hypothetical protein